MASSSAVTVFEAVDTVAAAAVDDAATEAMEWGGTALGKVAHTVSMVLSISSLIELLFRLLDSPSPPATTADEFVKDLVVEDDDTVVPRERERPTPSLVPTRRALMGGGGGDDDTA